MNHLFLPHILMHSIFKALESIFQKDLFHDILIELSEADQFINH